MEDRHTKDTQTNTNRRVQVPLAAKKINEGSGNIDPGQCIFLAHDLPESGMFKICLQCKNGSKNVPYICLMPWTAVFEKFTLIDNACKGAENSGTLG